MGDSPLERLWLTLLKTSFARFTDRITFEWFNALSADEMVARARPMPPRSLIYYAMVRLDVHGLPPEEDRVLRRLHPRRPHWTGRLLQVRGSGVRSGTRHHPPAE